MRIGGIHFPPVVLDPWAKSGLGRTNMAISRHVRPTAWRWRRGASSAFNCISI
jgi:hypothetical protein